MAVPMVPFPRHLFQNRQVKILGLDDPPGTERCHWCGKIIDKQNKSEIEEHMHEKCKKEEKTSNICMAVMVISIIFLICMIPLVGYFD